MTYARESGQDVLALVGALRPTLPPSERRVAEHILQDPASAAELTISALATRAETSEATVMRLCHRLELTGYPALRIGLATAAGRAQVDDSARLAPEIDASDPLHEVVAKVGAADARAVTDTIAGVDLETLESVVSAIAAARRIDVYGVGASGNVAADLQQKLHRIGLTAGAWSDPHLALPSASNLRAGDVAVAISHTGTTIDTCDALSVAREAGAVTVAITNDPRSAIATIADLVLRTHATEAGLRSGAMGSRLAELALVDCVFVAVAQRRYDTTLAAVARTADSVRSRHRTRRRAR